MTTDSAVIEKREELKRRLAAGEYKTLIDIFLEKLDRFLRKIIRQSKPLPIWLITSLLCFAIVGIGNILSIKQLIHTLDLYGFIPILSVNLLNILVIVSPVVLNQSIRRILSFWQNDILDATDSLASLEDIEDWLNMTGNWRLHLIVTISGGIANGLYLMFTDLLQGVYTSYGWLYSILITAFIVGPFLLVFLYLFLMSILLSARLRRYSLILFPIDPSSSELIYRLSSHLNFFLYFGAAYGATSALLVALSGGFSSAIGLSHLLFLWVPIVVMFFLNESSLSSIIRRAKWKTLNEIQLKLEKLQAKKDFDDKETMDAINRLMDYHNRIKETRNSAIDLTTTLNFINSLLLPLLAFVLGNFASVLAFFRR